MGLKALPIGFDNFKRVISDGFYYVDKTDLIKDLIDKGAAVNLFTRPRRFGKSLNMSMLQYFFENTGDEILNEENRNLFYGLRIMEAGDKYTDLMGHYPVISLSLKFLKQPSFDLAFACLKEDIAKEFQRHKNILSSLTVEKQKKFIRISTGKGGKEDYIRAILFLSEALYEFYGRNTIILIDEYDVPLENAWFSGFYEEMSGLMRSLFESALKTNLCLEFAVLTGCLSISKESIFTGLNNLEIISILNPSYGEHFGFLQSEVDEMLRYYGAEHARDTIKDWYDGYLFGDFYVYNPWSVINYVKCLDADPEFFPSPYWSNTSSNSIVRELIEHADGGVREEIEQLIEGGSIEKQIHEDITYEDIYETQDNLWNFLFFTGYLKQTGRRLELETQYVTLSIPNLEVLYIYKNTVRTWFEQSVKQKNLGRLYEAIENGDTAVMEEEISSNLQATISFFDYAESYYHGFMTGLLKGFGKYRIQSNRESGLGRPDLILRTPSLRGRAIIMELKAVKHFHDLENGCEEARKQIVAMKYMEGLKDEGFESVTGYAISFFRKDCAIKAL